MAETYVPAFPYRWPFDGRMNARNTALLVIDMQRDFCEEDGYLSLQGYDLSEIRAIIPDIKSLLSACRRSKMMIFHTREGHRPDRSDLSEREIFRSRNNVTGIGIGDAGKLGDVLIRGEAGWDTIPELYPHTGEPIIDKPGKGAFTYTDLDQMLRLKGIRNLILCGVTTDVCVHTTMREANDRGFDCLLVEDCCAASEEGLHAAAVEMVTSEGGVFGSTGKVKDIVRVIDRMGSPRVSGLSEWEQLELEQLELEENG